MAERVTQRASFGNLTPTARPVDTFHRPDSRGLDEFVQWADDRLKATEGFLKAGAGAYQTYRESKFEEVRLKARADAVKNFYDPRRLDKERPDFDPSIHLETDSSYALYDEEVKRIQSGLKGIEAGKGLLKDDKDLNYIFEETQRRKTDKNYKKDDKSAYNPNITEEEVFKEFRDFEFKNLPEDVDAYFLEKYNQAWGEFEDKFFERLQKQTVGKRVDTLSALTQSWIESGQLAFKLPPEGEEIKLEDDDEFFYSQLGSLLQEGIASGLTENHAQAVVIKQLLLHAESFDRETKDQEAGEITEKEEGILVKIMSALDAKDTQRHFVKSGGSIAGNTFFDEIAGSGIDKINKMLEEKDNKDDADSIKKNKRDGGRVTQDIYQDIYSGKITTLEQLNKEIDRWQKADWNLNYSLPVADILSTFNRYSTAGGRGDMERFRDLHIDILTGKIREEDLIKDPKYFTKGKNKNLSFQQQIQLHDLVFNSDAGPLQLQKVEINGLEQFAVGAFGGKAELQYLLADSNFFNAYRAIQTEFNKDVEAFIKKGGFTRNNKPSIEQEEEFFEKIRPKFIKKIEDLKNISTNLETRLNLAKIDLKNIDGTLPDIYKKLEDGIPKAFYRDSLYFFDKEKWEHLFEGEFSSPKALQLYANAGEGRQERKNMIEAVQKYLLKDNYHETHYLDWLESELEKKPTWKNRVGSFWDMMILNR